MAATMTMQANEEGMERLRNILSQEPEKETWEELIECFDNWPDDSSLSAAVDYAKQELTAWPDYLRTPPTRQWRAIQEGAPLPRWWQLVRRIELGEDDHPLGTLPEVLKNITSIELQYSGISHFNKTHMVKSGGMQRTDRLDPLKPAYGF